MSIKVRPATPGDTEWLMAELKEFCKFFESKHSLVGDELHWRGILDCMIREHVVFIAENDAECRIGLIAGYFVGHPFNPKIRLLTEAFWWVSPGYRRTRAGLLLLNAFVRFGEQNADWISMALESKSPVSDQCLLRRGFHLHERSYLRET